MRILQKTNDESINLALDTIKIGKQALVFANTKASAEATAEKISIEIKKLNPSAKTLDDISEKALHSLTRPTKQCERLARMIKYGIAFHHAGLTSEQKTLIEDNFRKGSVKIISCTPTLAAGVDLPAFRTILRNLRRYSFKGLDWIPVLEYQQMAGRAGRPKFDDFGEAIAIAKTEPEKDEIKERYIFGEVEDVYSKLAVEPVLRTYILSLIASNFARTKKQLLDFFERTFWAHQFKDMQKLEATINKMLHLLKEWELIEIEGRGEKAKDFVSALNLSENKMSATLIGKRIAELYVDPYTANFIITALKRAKDKMLNELKAFSFLQIVSNCLEMKPTLRTRVREFEEMEQKAVEFSDCLLQLEPPMFDPDYNEFIDSIKTALFFQNWIDEKDEEYLLEEYKVRPGEIKVRLDRADWLLYCSEEVARILKMQEILHEISKTRFRLKYGVKEELFPLLKLRDVGRVRARKMFNHEIRTIGDVKKVQFEKLALIVGNRTAARIKEHVGIVIDKSKIVIKKGTRKGQLSLNKFR